MTREPVRLLVSVRNEAEASLAASGGADFIDLKEPRDGALGGLPVGRVRDIVRALRRQGRGAPAALSISATIGDRPMHDLAGILARVEAVGTCGVDYVKVGIDRTPDAITVLDALAASGAVVVPVFIADRGLDDSLVARACMLGFAGVMVDTADKLRGSLFDCVDPAGLQGFVQTVRRSGALVGLAGALRLSHLPALRGLAPDFAGFRSAVCAGDRSSALDPRRLAVLAEQLKEPLSTL